MTKANAIYTLTLDYTREGQPTRKVTWTKQTHRDALRKLHNAQERGDGAGYPLQRWMIDSGWHLETGTCREKA
jgi:hypothetical protein